MEDVVIGYAESLKECELFDKNGKYSGCLFVLIFRH